MNRIIKSLFFAGIAYDESGFQKKLVEFASFEKVSSQIYFCEILTDFWFFFKSGNTLEIAIRGTDGTSLKKWFAAWKRNFTVEAQGPDGFSTGFNHSSDLILAKSFGQIKSLSEDCEHIVFSDHSAGGAIGPITAVKLSRELKRRVLAYSFASAPHGDYRVQDAYNDVHCEYGTEFEYFINPGDPMTWMFRDHRSPQTDGYDMGNGITLPVSEKSQRFIAWIPFLRAFEHSPREYCKSLMRYFKGNKKAVDDLKWVYSRLVN